MDHHLPRGCGAAPQPDTALRRGHRLIGAAVSEVSFTARVATRWISGFGEETIHAPAGTPAGGVLLVHGFGANKSHFTALERVLLREGYTVCSVNYPWARTSLAGAGAHVAADAETFSRITGIEDLHIVGHSLGGIVSRWALSNTDLGDRTVSLTTLGSPHRGAPLAHLAPASLPGVGSLLAQLRVTSADLRQLAHPGELPHVRHTAIGGSLDVIVPARCARLPRAANVVNEVTVAGHIAMPASQLVVRRVLETLRTTQPAASAVA